MREMPNAHAREALARRAACALLAALVWLGAPAAHGQSPAAKEAPAAVEGRVTDGDEGLAGVVVVLLRGDPSAGPPRPAARARTDHEGRYRLSGVQPGTYQVLPLAPVFVLPETLGYPPGRRLTLGAGETAGDVDFRLTRGGVITGRVTDAEGQPVIGESVHVTTVDETRQNAPTSFPQRHLTDDRGVYRIYGLAAGRYLVSAGQDAEAGEIRMGGGGRFYRRTFHPAAFDKTQARVVEVAAGAEATDVDITLGRAAKTYRAAGRFVGADGRPAPGVAFGYGLIDREGVNLGPFGAGLVTDSRGEFTIDGLVPGRYAVFAMSMDERPTETYSDAVTFEVEGADVGGLEVKLRRGAVVSGVVHIEGTSDPATAARLLRQVRLYASTEVPAGGAPTPPNFTQTTPGPDGGFRFVGVRPGRLRVGMNTSSTATLVLTRVELNGALMNDGVEVAEGARVGGLRLVVSYGSAVVRGQVNILNGTIADGARLYVFARRLDGGGGGEPQYDTFGKGTEADARGRFVLQGLAAGSYELTARVFSPQGDRQQSQRVQVTLPEGGEATATLTLDLGNK